MTVKQIIVMRKDLKMRRGKEIAQGGHSVMKDMIFAGKKETVIENGIEYMQFTLKVPKGDPWEIWLNNSFTKICVTVNSEQELIDVYNKAVAAGLSAAMVEDNGLTEFNGVKTKTCCAIGPADAEVLAPITGHLPLY